MRKNVLLFLPTLITLHTVAFQHDASNILKKEIKIIYYYPDYDPNSMEVEFQDGESVQIKLAVQKPSARYCMKNRKTGEVIGTMQITDPPPQELFEFYQKKYNDFYAKTLTRKST